MVEEMELKNKINWITTKPLTMEKWDSLILILKENELDGLTKELYKNRDHYENMLLNIKITARNYKDNHTGDNKIID